MKKLAVIPLMFLVTGCGGGAASPEGAKRPQTQQTQAAPSPAQVEEEARKNYEDPREKARREREAKEAGVPKERE
jgi:hypothetical protein